MGGYSRGRRREKGAGSPGAIQVYWVSRWKENRAWTEVGELGSGAGRPRRKKQSRLPPQQVEEKDRKLQSPSPPHSQRNSREVCPRNPTPSPGAPVELPRRRVPARHLRALNSGAAASPPPRLTSARREHPPLQPQPPRKRLPMPGGRRHSGALSSRGKPGRAPSWVHPPREPRAPRQSRGRRPPARRPASSRAPAPPAPSLHCAPRRGSPTRCRAATVAWPPAARPSPDAPALRLLLRLLPRRCVRRPSALQEPRQVALATRRRRKSERAGAPRFAVAPPEPWCSFLIPAWKGESGAQSPGSPPRLRGRRESEGEMG